MRAPRSNRIVLSVIGALLLATTAIVALRGSVSASSGDTQYFVDQINALRQSVGVGPLSVDGNMAGLAADHTAAMVGSGQLVHASNLATGVSGPWARLGENIGQGGDAATVWNMFVNSPGHYANLTNPAFTHVGVAVAYDAGGQLWTTHRFVARPGGGGSAIQPAAPPEPVRAPMAAPKPRPVKPQASAPAPPPAPALPPPPPLPTADPARVGALLEVLHASPD